MPQFEQINSFASQIFWLILSFGLLYFILSKLILPRIGNILENRREKIQKDLEKSELAKIEATKLLKEYEAILDKARAEASDLVSKANLDISEKVNSSLAEFEIKMQKQADEADKKLDKARKKALLDVENIASDLTVATVKNLIDYDANDKEVKEVLSKQ